MSDPRQERRRLLAQSSLYLVIDGLDGGEKLAQTVGQALAGGVGIVQLREKRRRGSFLLGAAKVVRDLCKQAGALFILNDLPALAVAVGADGVHLGQEDIAVPIARRLVGEDLLIGLSTHSPSQVEAAQGCGADYIGVGPVFPTPTKPGRPAVGVELVRFAAQRSTLPWFAIGGIDATNVGEVAAAGAKRVAVVRALANAADPASAARQLLVGLGREVAVAGRS